MIKNLIKIVSILAFAILTFPASAQMQLQSGGVWGNATGSTAPPQDTLLSPLLDLNFCGTQNSFIQRGASNWGCVQNLIVTGTSTPSSSAGETAIAGTLASIPTLTGNGQGFIFNTTVGGLILEGIGSTDDLRIYNKGGTLVLNLPTGTTSPVLPALGSGTCASALAIDATNKIITNTCPGAASSIAVLGTTVTSATSGDVLATTSSGCSVTTPCLADTAIAAGSGTMTFTKNQLITLSIQDASSSQDTLSFGQASSTTCDPGYIGTPGNGPCSQIKTNQSASNVWSALLLNSVNSRVIMAANGGVGNPELQCADTNAFGIPVWGGGNQSGCGFFEAARVGANNPVSFNFVAGGQLQSSITASLATGISGNGKLTVTVASGQPIIFGETFVGAGFTKFLITGTSTTGSGNCSPACTGAGGTGTYATSLSTTIGSELMIGGPSGAEGSASIQIWGGSLAGDTQNILMFFNATGCALWSASPCSATAAGARLGEIAGTGMSGDGLFTQTETGSWNIYAALNFSGTHLDGSYTAPTNMVLRLGPNASAPERVTAVFDYNANLFLGTSWTVTTANGITGALFVGTAVTTNAGLINSVYAPASQQGMTIQNIGGDTGGGHAILFSRTDGTSEGSVVVSASGTTYNTTSDRRLKTDIVSTSADEVGSIIDRLQVVDYKFKDDLSRKYIGFIAQDEYAVYPDAVSKGDTTDAQPGEEGFAAWGRDDSRLVPLLVREVQVLRERVRQLESAH